MAIPEAVNNFRDVLYELECLVAVRNNLASSCVNFEYTTDLIVEKLVGLRVFGENDLHGASVEDLGRFFDIRNTIVERQVYLPRNYGEHWPVLDAFLQ